MNHGPKHPDHRLGLAAAIRPAILAMVLVATAGCDRISSERADWGQIRVNSSPSGASLFINGQAWDATPTTVTRLASGAHLLELRKEGYRTARRTVVLLPGRRAAVDITMEPLNALILVESVPPSAEVEINGNFRGVTPLLLTDVPLGTHRLLFRAPGFQPKTMEVSAMDRIPRRVQALLTSDAATLSVVSTPTGATVFVNGARQGETPCTVDRVPAGEANIELTLEGFYPHREKRALRAGDALTIDVALRPQPSVVRVVSIPDGARVYLNDEYAGVTPMVISNLPPGAHRVRAEAKGHEPAARTVRVPPAGAITEEFRLTRNSGTLILVTEPAGVEVFVDGERQGVTISAVSAVVSDPFVVDWLPRGPHTVQLARTGYTHSPVRIQIESGQVVNLHEKMTRRFIPDTLVRTGIQPQDVRTGALIRQHPNGDIVLETAPGITVTIRKAEILSIEPLRDDAP